MMHSEDRFHRRMAIPQQFGWLFLRLHDIVAVEAERSYCTFHCLAARRVTVSRSLAWAEERLNTHGFIRSHRSWLVNPIHVEELSRKDGMHLRLSNGLDIPVSGLHRENLLQQLLATHFLPSANGNAPPESREGHWEDGMGER